MDTSTIIGIIELSIAGVELIPGMKTLFSSNKKENEQLLRKYLNEIKQNKMQLDVINFDTKDFKHNKDVLNCINKLNYEAGLEVNTKIGEFKHEIKTIKKQQKKINKNTYHNTISHFVTTPVKIQELKSMMEDDNSLLFKKCHPKKRLKNIKKATDEVYNVLTRYFSSKK